MSATTSSVQVNLTTSSPNTSTSLIPSQQFNFSCNGSIPECSDAREAFQKICGCRIPPDGFLQPELTEEIFSKFFLVVSVIGNLLVVIVLNRMKRGFFNSSTKALLQNLSVADITVCVLYNINDAIGVNSKLTTDFTCKFFGGLLWASLSTSSCSVCCVSIERYLAVVRPLEFHLNTKKAILMAIFGWYYSLLFTLPDFYFLERFYVNICLVGKVPYCYYSHWPGGADIITLNLTNVIATFVVPLGIVMFTNISIMKVLLYPAKASRQFRRSGESRNRRRSGVVVIVLFLTAIYIVCSVPFTVYYIITAMPVHVKIPKKFPHVAYYLMMANSSCNPFVYSFFSAEFRRECVRLLCAPYRWITGRFSGR